MTVQFRPLEGECRFVDEAQIVNDTMNSEKEGQKLQP